MTARILRDLKADSKTQCTCSNWATNIRTQPLRGVRDIDSFCAQRKDAPKLCEMFPAASFCRGEMLPVGRKDTVGRITRNGVSADTPPTDKARYAPCELSPSAESELVGWVELAIPMLSMRTELMGIAALHAILHSCSARASAQAGARHKDAGMKNAPASGAFFVGRRIRPRAWPGACRSGVAPRPDRPGWRYHPGCRTRPWRSCAGCGA